jgi:multiple sugar transport system substrate-binding protein
MTRFLKVAALLMSLALAVAACGSNDQSQPGTSGQTGSQPPAASAGDVTGEIDVWAMGQEGALLDRLITDFETEYPEVTVNLTPVPWDQAVTKLQTAVAGTETPDVTQMGTDMMAQFVSSGAMEAVPANFTADTYFESAWNTGVIDGTAYGVPWYVETRVLYERSDLADEAGLSEPPASWDDLKAAAVALKDGGAEWGVSLGVKNAQEYLPYFWSNGGTILNDDGTFGFDSPEAIEALTFYDSFFEEGLAQDNPAANFDLTPAFAAGTHPMAVSGPWHMGLFDDAGAEGKWSVALHPGKDDAPGTSWIGGSNLTVFKDSDNKAAAWAFVEYLTRPEVQVKWYDVAAALPSVQSAWDDPAMADDESLAVFGEQLASTQAPPAIATWSEISTKLNEELEKMTVGDQSPEDTAAAMQEAATSIGTGE